MTNAAKPKELLFVVGMHRSGTSAICAALSACGVSFGKQLINAMDGVNEEGFWEDARMVSLNEKLLELAGSTWFTPTPKLADVDWGSHTFDPIREQAKNVLLDDFGSFSLKALKDPRLCLTLPFWLTCCKELDIPVRVCVISRAPLEVARSLEKRDGFPIGYGLRLYALYRSCVQSAVPEDTLYVLYDNLFRDACSVMLQLATVLPLTIGTTDFSARVRDDLRHHNVGEEDEGELLMQAGSGELDLAVLACEIEARYPADQTLRDFAHRLTERGLALTQIGEEHSVALSTLDQRDGEIREFDRRLSRLGDEHFEALKTLRERDAELSWIKHRLETLRRIPGIGYLITQFVMSGRRAS